MKSGDADEHRRSFDLFDQLIVIGMSADPKPEHTVFDLYPQHTIFEADSNRPIFADFLQMQ
jgi:hypothetical protein